MSETSRLRFTRTEKHIYVWGVPYAKLIQYGGNLDHLTAPEKKWLRTFPVTGCGMLVQRSNDDRIAYRLAGWWSYYSYDIAMEALEKMVEEEGVFIIPLTSYLGEL